MGREGEELGNYAIRPEAASDKGSVYQTNIPKLAGENSMLYLRLCLLYEELLSVLFLYKFCYLQRNGQRGPNKPSSIIIERANSVSKDGRVLHETLFPPKSDIKTFN